MGRYKKLMANYEELVAAYNKLAQSFEENQNGTERAYNKVDSLKREIASVRESKDALYKENLGLRSKLKSLGESSRDVQNRLVIKTLDRLGLLNLLDNQEGNVVDIYESDEYFAVEFSTDPDKRLIIRLDKTISFEKLSDIVKLFTPWEIPELSDALELSERWPDATIRFLPCKFQYTEAVDSKAASIILTLTGVEAMDFAVFIDGHDEPLGEYIANLRQKDEATGEFSSYHFASGFCIHAKDTVLRLTQENSAKANGSPTATPNNIGVARKLEELEKACKKRWDIRFEN